MRLETGQPVQALADFLEAGSIASLAGIQNPAFLPWRSQAALALRQLGRLDEARALAREELELSRIWGAPRTVGVSLRALGLVEEGGERAHLLREAVEVLAGSPARLEHARALVDLGTELRRSNSRSAARQLLREGVEFAHRCSATRLVERGNEELAATGAHPRTILLSGLDALTASERRVAQMAAEDLRNKEIAQALFVTVKTVEQHRDHPGTLTTEELAQALTVAEVATTMLLDGQEMAAPGAAAGGRGRGPPAGPPRPARGTRRHPHPLDPDGRGVDRPPQRPPGGQVRFQDGPRGRERVHARALPPGELELVDALARRVRCCRDAADAGVAHPDSTRPRRRGIALTAAAQCRRSAPAVPSRSPLTVGSTATTPRRAGVITQAGSVMLQHQVDQPAQHLGRASNRKSLLVRAAGPAGSGRTPPGFAGLDDTVGVEQHPVTGFEAGLHDLDAANPPLAWLIEFELKHLSATIRQRELGAVRVVPTWGTRVAALRECGLRRGEQLAASRAADTSWAQRWQDAACAGANGISGNTAHPDTGAPHRATVWEV